MTDGFELLPEPVRRLARDGVAREWDVQLSGEEFTMECHCDEVHVYRLAPVTAASFREPIARDFLSRNTCWGDPDEPV